MRLWKQEAYQVLGLLNRLLDSFESRERVGLALKP